MLTATVKGFDRFSSVSEDIDALCLAALTAAAEIGAEVAEANSTIDLEIVVQRAEGDVEGFSSGFLSRTEGRKETIRLGPLFDGGTLGRRRKKLKQPGRREDSWQVNRGGTSYTAHRHPIVDDQGIKAEGFFGKARSAGRKALLARIDRGADAVRFFGR